MNKMFVNFKGRFVNPEQIEYQERQYIRSDKVVRLEVEVERLETKVEWLDAIKAGGDWVRVRRTEDGEIELSAIPNPPHDLLEAAGFDISMTPGEPVSITLTGQPTDDGVILNDVLYVRADSIEKPVVWVRQMPDALMYRCNGETGIVICDLGMRPSHPEKIYHDIAEVKVWGEPEPDTCDKCGQNIPSDEPITFKVAPGINDKFTAPGRGHPVYVNDQCLFEGIDYVWGNDEFMPDGESL